MSLPILCLQIFVARICDVSFGTARTILMVKGRTILAGFIGFVEVLIWFVIVREALTSDITSWWVPISYAAGFAAGTLIGGMISHKYISGNYGIQVVLHNESDDVPDIIRKEGHAVSVIKIEGQEKDRVKHMLFIEVNKRNLNDLRKLILSLDPKAFIVVSETKLVQNGFIK